MQTLWSKREMTNTRIVDYTKLDASQIEAEKQRLSNRRAEAILIYNKAKKLLQEVDSDCDHKLVLLAACEDALLSRPTRLSSNHRGMD